MVWKINFPSITHSGKWSILASNYYKLVPEKLRCQKFFELPNHLGNVLVAISDKKYGHDGGGGVVDYYNPDVVNANDYYPFGMLQPGRKFSAGSLYRYGFNGKENDNDVKGEGNQQDYGMRIYDPRVGRFLSVDPLTKNYPWYTPFQYSANNRLNSWMWMEQRSMILINIIGNQYH